MPTDQRRRAPSPHRRTPRASHPPTGSARRGGDPGDDRAARDRGRDGAPGRRSPVRGTRRPATSTPRSTTSASVVKQLAMRRTLFVFPRDLLPAAWGSASARVATAEGKRIAKAIAAAGIADDGDAWLEAARAATLTRLADGPATVAELRAVVPELAGTVGGDTDKPYDRAVPVAPWVLTHLGLDGADAARAQRRPLAAQQAELDPHRGLARRGAGTASDEAAGYAELVRRWLRTFGPGTAATSSGGSARRRPPSPGRSPTWRRWRSPSTTARPAGCCPTTPTTPARRAVGSPAADARPDASWAGRRAPSTSTPATSPTSSTPTATPAPPRGGTAGSSAAGCRTPDGVVRLSLLEDVGPTGRAALDREAERLTALARRHRHRHRLRLAPDEAGQAPSTAWSSSTPAARTRTPSHHPRVRRRPSTRRAPRRSGGRSPGRCRPVHALVEAGQRGEDALALPPRGRRDRGRAPRSGGARRPGGRPPRSREAPASLNFAALSTRFISTERSCGRVAAHLGSSPLLTQSRDTRPARSSSAETSSTSRSTSIVTRGRALGGELQQVVDQPVHPLDPRRARATVSTWSGSVISSSRDSRDSETEVSGFLRSWLTWPAKCARRSLEVLRRGWPR